MIMTERLAAMPPISELLGRVAGDPRALLDELLYRMPYADLGDSGVRHGCLCSQRAVLASLATLPREEIVELMRGDDVLEITCDYCTAQFQIPSVQLQGLLTAS
jgi:redox-regulated HSP33 family molecular chaperone